jgi:hypothetical protein
MEVALTTFVSSVEFSYPSGWDIMPITEIEVIYSSLLVVSGVMLISAIIGSASSIASSLGAGAKSKKAAQLDMLMSYLR